MLRRRHHKQRRRKLRHLHRHLLKLPSRRQRLRRHLVLLPPLLLPDLRTIRRYRRQLPRRQPKLEQSSRRPHLVSRRRRRRGRGVRLKKSSA